ncbi:3-deoxy-manno-octulosonate cytidylyltransferase [Psychrobacter sp. HD31]|uniref:3-deoxy-manno-octulosonate cytidylyltransferase n=1 Tax=Psychrobacter sp. HD31 TaxID=3112003 RepID=UPI003DA37CB3
MNSVAIIIPARFASSRFPGKPLADILGKPMIQHVYEKALQVPNAQVVVATDDKRVFNAVQNFGGTVVMTDTAHTSGTDRLVEVMTKVDADLYINLQGDEPLVRPSDLNMLIRKMSENPSIGVSTMCHHISATEAKNPNTVKVVTSSSNRACYFSRSPIPYPRDESISVKYKQHVGVYAYRKSILAEYQSLHSSRIEDIEKLEQLRLLNSDVSIYVFDVAKTGPGVDTPEDLEKVISIIEGKEQQQSKIITFADVDLVITDIDGVLTDGGLYYDENGEALKRFHVRDGLGIKLLQESGIKVAVLSGRDSKPLRKRIADLGIEIFALGIKDKETACKEIIAKANTIKANTVYIGDDSIDLPAFDNCGISVAVADSPSYIKEKADVILDTKGGFGAFRELSDQILIEQKKGSLLGNSADFLRVHACMAQ